MAALFISYTREDGKTYAYDLGKALDGRDPWLDRADLVGGADWVQEIEKAIDESAVFLPVLTRAYHGSRFAPLELARAFRLRKPLIPLRFHPDADLGLFLERTQWIDFCDPATQADSLRALIERIDDIRNGRAQAPGAPAAAAQWEGVRGHAERQTRRVITPAVFDPRLYVRRAAVEDQLVEFLAGSEGACILIGDSGTGKSSILFHLALDLIAQGHAVLTYDCSTLADTELDDDVARDLGVSELDLERLDAEAAAAGKNLVLIFDSISDYRGSERNGVQVLIRRLHTLVTRLPGRNVRVVLSCNTAAWDRLERTAPIRFDPAQFHHQDGDPFLRVAPFSDAERDEAYTRYREVFDLFSPVDALPPAVKERLREPVLLRMTAEAYRGVKQPLVAANLGLAIYRRYFDDRVSSGREILLVGQLADQMLARKTSALPMIDLARHETLGPEILNEDPASTYSVLLDRGVLQELRGDVRAGIVVKFAHTRVAAYALAVNLLQRGGNVAQTVAELVQQAAQFPLAWETARTLLLLSEDPAAFLTLAAASDPEQRALVADALVELHAQDPRMGTSLLQRLLDEKSEGTRRTALKAAYNIGPAARDFFLRAAVDGEQAMRESVKNTLYLIWRNESQGGRQVMAETLYLIWRRSPGFTYDFLKSLLGEIRLTNILNVKPAIEFILDLIITIYINHPEEPEVIEKTADLLYELSVGRLHMDRVNLGAVVDKVVVHAITRVFGQQVLDWMMFKDITPVQPFFRLPAERRAMLSAIADFYDPATKLADAHDTLLALLREELPIFGASAAMAIGIHASQNFAATEPLVRRLWDETGPAERRWLLHAFMVLFKGTPDEWVPFLEELTQRYVDEHREDFLVPPTPLARELDLNLVPLGLAYGKRGTGMPYFDRLLGDAIAANDMPLTARIIAALNAVGFYYPGAVFRVLEPAFAKLDDERVAAALVSTLATIRTLHFDAVDQFLNRVEAPETLRRRIDASADVALVHRFIRVLGFYNNGVHLSTKYPRMRRCFSAGSLRILSTAKNGVQFTVDYTLAALRMARESKFRAMEWTLPE